MINGLFEFALISEYTDRNVAREIRSFGKVFFDSRGRFNAREVYYELPELTTDDEDDDEMFGRDDYDESEDLYLQYFSAEEQAQLITTALKLMSIAGILIWRSLWISLDFVSVNW